MPDFIASASRDLPFILLLIALLGVRWRVSPRASVFIAAPMEKVFALLDFREGEEQRWQRTRVTCRIIDAASRTFRLNFVTPLATGATQSSEADFRVARRDEPHLLDIERAGLEGRSQNNELLKMSARLAPEGAGSRLDLTYVWGPRPVLAQLLARTDLWGKRLSVEGHRRNRRARLPHRRADLGGRGGGASRTRARRRAAAARRPDARTRRGRRRDPAAHRRQRVRPRRAQPAGAGVSGRVGQRRHAAVRHAALEGRPPPAGPAGALPEGPRRGSGAGSACEERHRRPRPPPRAGRDRRPGATPGRRAGEGAQRLRRAERGRQREGRAGADRLRGRRRR